MALVRPAPLTTHHPFLYCEGTLKQGGGLNGSTREQHAPAVGATSSRGLSQAHPLSQPVHHQSIRRRQISRSAAAAASRALDERRATAVREFHVARRDTGMTQARDRAEASASPSWTPRNKGPAATSLQTGGHPHLAGAGSLHIPFEVPRASDPCLAAPASSPSPWTPVPQGPDSGSVRERASAGPLGWEGASLPRPPHAASPSPSLLPSSTGEVTSSAAGQRQHEGGYSREGRGARGGASGWRAQRRKDAEAWAQVASDVQYRTRTVQLVQWYPGHIAKAERDLREQLKWVDVVLEVRDARIPLATTHPQIDEWIGQRPKVVVLNREDMVTSADRTAWAEVYGRQDVPFCFTDGKRGAGILKLNRAAMSVSASINGRRKEKGLLPRPVRAAVVGFPNVGKSAVINRLVKRRVCDSAPRPGVTREVRWVKLGASLDLLDAPGVLPMRIADQAAAARLAMCNDIGQAAYAVSGVAAILFNMLCLIPSIGPQALSTRYKVRAEGQSGEEFLEALADKLFMGDVDQASHRVLKDFRTGALGWTALERPPT